MINTNLTKFATSTTLTLFHAENNTTVYGQSACQSLAESVKYVYDAMLPSTVDPPNTAHPLTASPFTTAHSQDRNRTFLGYV